jgi:HD superfamily phosphohydrolase
MELVDSPWFQRLRHCAQNGPTRLVYPSILGTRFEHSIGVMDLASRLFHSAIKTQKYGKKNHVVESFLSICKRDLRLFLGRKSKDVIGDVDKILRMTALCHDIGHFPLSHTLERAFDETFMPWAIPRHLPVRVCHELVSTEIVRYILECEGSHFEPWVGRAVILVMLAPSELSIKYRQKHISCSNTMFHTLNSIIMGDYDADRLDYLQRDGYLSGSGFGRIDVQRFIDAMMLFESANSYITIPTSKALSTIEACLIERYKLFKCVL